MLKPLSGSFSHKSLTMRYLFALSLIAILVSLSTFSFQKIISDQRYASNTISRAGAERVLLETIKVYHVAYLAYRGDPRQVVIHKKLSDAATALETNHQALLDREESENLGGEMIPAVRALYFDSPVQLNQQISDYVALARRLLSLTDQELDEQPILSSSFVDLTETLLTDMQTVVNAHVTQSENALKKMGELEILLWISAMIVLLLEALFIFRPMMETITKQFLMLGNQTKTLQDKIVELKTTQHELVKSQKIASLGRMVSGFSHELSTPVGIAVSAVSQMQDAAERVSYEINAPTIDLEALKHNTENLNETATLAANNLARAGRLVESFKQSSIDRHSELSREFNLKSLAEDTVYNLSHQLKHKNVVVKVNCAEHLFLDGRPSLIEQLITNLVSNSLAHGYNEKGGLINIDLILDHENQTMSIAYKDDGRGIDKAIIDNIFEPFFTSTRTGGSGLGLYICHSIVTQDLSGTITCHSITNQGVTFLIKFPLEVEPTPYLELNSVEG
ncbi:HAMP domain-containing histidine kinase [Porticoccaceae bacterium]|nr:HAMP domain-containing histidine kinase [Porticoccaceae bacterium]